MSNLERPPLGAWLRYRLASSRVPEPYIAWVERDIRSPWWPWLSGAPLPMAVTLAAFLGSVVTGAPSATRVAVYLIAFVVGAGVARGLHRVSRIRGMFDRRRVLALRYQRGEITRSEWSGLQSGEFSWNILALALGSGALVFIVLFVLDRQ